MFGLATPNGGGFVDENQGTAIGVVGRGEDRLQVRALFRPKQTLPFSVIQAEPSNFAGILPARARLQFDDRHFDLRFGEPLVGRAHMQRNGVG